MPIILCKCRSWWPARSKAWVCGRSFAGIVGSNSAGGMDVCPLRVLCVVRSSESGWSFIQRSLTGCGVSECDREASIMRTTWIVRGCSGMANVLQIAVQIISNCSNIKQNTLQIFLLILDRWRRCSLQLFYRTLGAVDTISVSVSNRSDTVQLYWQFDCTNTNTLPVAPLFMYTPNIWINRPNNVPKYTLLYTTLHVDPLQESAKYPRLQRASVQ